MRAEVSVSPLTVKTGTPASMAVLMVFVKAPGGFGSTERQSYWFALRPEVICPIWVGASGFATPMTLVEILTPYFFSMSAAACSAPACICAEAPAIVMYG